MVPERWEHGSHFHELPGDGAPELPWGAGEVRLYGTGRDALIALLRRLGPARVFAPTYYCPDVFEAIRRERVALELYEDSPVAALSAPAALRPGDAWLRCNTLGLRPAVPAGPPSGVTVIDDHSHDLLSAWARDASGDYAFASLRKTLPLPDGGALWSPRGLPLPGPAPVTPEHQRVAEQRAGAMRLKVRYLAGAPLAKEAFYAPLVASEGALGTGLLTGMTAEGQARLARCPTVAWRERRARNAELLFARLATAGVRWLQPAPGAVPFVATLVVDDAAQRERLRQALIARSVFPAVLWALDEAEVGRSAASLGQRVLCIQVDQRYDAADMERVSQILLECLATCR